MGYYELRPLQMYCQNCGNKVMGYRSRDRTAHISCGRCGVKFASKKIDGRTIDTRMIAPSGQVLLFDN